MELKPKDERIMAALLSCGSIAEAGQKAGVSRTMIYKRLSDDAFKAEYNARRAAVLDEACNALQSTLTEATQVIREIMANEENAPQIRLNAAALILQNCLKYVEQVNIISRLEKLEKQEIID